MDSLELTIDSVARNFGTNDDQMSPVPLTAANSQQSPQVSKTNSPSLILLSSPKTLQTPSAEQAPQIQSPPKATKKTRKQQIKLLKNKLRAGKRNLAIKIRNKRKGVARERVNKNIPLRSGRKLKSLAHLQELLESRQVSKVSGCACTRFDYTFDNQIRLRHRQIELITENLPLSFDILEKLQLSVCTGPNQLTCWSKNNNSASCAFCATNGAENVHRCDTGNKSVVLAVNTQAEPFHHRQCYFGKHRSRRNPRVKLSKTVQLPHVSTSSKDMGRINVVLKEIDANEVDQLDEEETHETVHYKRRLDSDDELASNQSSDDESDE